MLYVHSSSPNENLYFHPSCLTDQTHVLAGLSHHIQIIEQEIVSLRSSEQFFNLYVAACQKYEMFKKLNNLVTSNGVANTVQFALEYYAKLPQTPRLANPEEKAYERALESFFIIANVKLEVQDHYNNLRKPI